MFAGDDHPVHGIFPHRIYALLIPSLIIVLALAVVTMFGAARVLFE